MLAKVNSAAFLGLKSLGVTVEVDIARRGFPAFEIVGLANKATAESKHRIKTAMMNLNIDFPTNKRITVNLAPADVPKDGSFYDLPIAVGLISLIYNVRIPPGSLFFGEVSLDGSLRHTKGAFLLALFARDKGFERIFVPVLNGSEVSSIPGFEVYPVENLLQISNFLRHGPRSGLDPLSGGSNFSKNSLEGIGDHDLDMGEIIGQETAKRSLEISAAGGHNFFMIGPPGSGKTLLAKTFPSILPPLEQEESLEVTKIYSAAGSIPPGGSLIKMRPFIAPHHTISYAGMIGGGTTPQPGQISLAHRGVLFMDEFPEFPRSILEMLRQPLEEGEIKISRSLGSFKFPCRFILIAAGNPCPCGFFGSSKDCTCTPGQMTRYKRKLSGPILDRIDLFTKVREVEFSKLQDFVLSGGNFKKGKKEVVSDSTQSKGKAESSWEIRKRVISARKIQKERFNKTEILTNSEMKNKHIKKYCSLKTSAKRILQQAADMYSLSARAYFKVLKVARTIADLSGVDSIKENHVAEALQYRYREK